MAERSISAMEGEETRLPFDPHSHHHAPGSLAAVQSVLFVLVTALFVMTFTVQPFRIPSESMEPTLLVGDFLLVSKQRAGATDSADLFASDTILRKDIIVFHYPLDAHMHLVKRVIGLPGERVHLHDGRVYINDRELTESYAVYLPSAADEYRDNFPRMDSPNPSVAPGWWVHMRELVRDGDLTVPAESYFVLGDNRNDSEDSRYWGLVPRSAIVGKPLLVYISMRQASVGENRGLSWRSRIAGLARWNRILKVIR